MARTMYDSGRSKRVRTVSNTPLSRSTPWISRESSVSTSLSITRHAPSVIAMMPACISSFIALSSTILDTGLWHCNHTELCISFQNDREARYSHSFKASLCHCHCFTWDLSAMHDQEILVAWLQFNHITCGFQGFW